MSVEGGTEEDIFEDALEYEGFGSKDVPLKAINTSLLFCGVCLFVPLVPSTLADAQTPPRKQQKSGI